MGIEDRDYMRPRSDDDSGWSGSGEEDAEALLSGILERHPRLPMLLITSLAALGVLVILAVKFAGKGG